MLYFSRSPNFIMLISIVIRRLWNTSCCGRIEKRGSRLFPTTRSIICMLQWLCLIFTLFEHCFTFLEMREIFHLNGNWKIFTAVGFDCSLRDNFLSYSITIMFMCAVCRKTFTRAYNLRRHEEYCMMNSCVVIPIKKFKTDGYAPSTSNTCLWCNVLRPTNKMISHDGSRQHRSSFWVPTTWWGGIHSKCIVESLVIELIHRQVRL